MLSPMLRSGGVVVGLTLVCVAGSPRGSMAAEPTAAIDVWPAGKMPGETGAIDPETTIEPKPGTAEVKRITNVTRPTLSVYKPAPDKDTGATVVIAPGGGYNILAIEHEGTAVAEWLNSVGVTGIVLKYRVPRRPGAPRDQRPVQPLQDAQRALRVVRERADEWKIDPQRIGVLGFSAGGNLAARLATQFDRPAYEAIDELDAASCRPDFVVLVYPAYLIQDNGGDLQDDVPVSKQTPPTFLVHAGDDPISPLNSVRMYAALKRAGVPAELHVFASGGHGFGMRRIPHPIAQWPDRCAEWMRANDWLRSQGETKPERR